MTSPRTTPQVVGEGSREAENLRETIESPGLEGLVERAFGFLCRKYVQRADARQSEMGLQYTEAETHDLARAVAAFGAATLQSLCDRIRELEGELWAAGQYTAAHERLDDLARESVAEANTARQKAEAGLAEAVEQAREVPEAVRQAVENWFSPWGSWKTSWWEDFAGDDHEYTSENFIKTLGRNAASVLTRLGEGG